MTAVNDPTIQELKSLVSQKKTFKIIASFGSIMRLCENCETTIESLGMSCRVRTKNRTAANAAALFTGVGVLGFMAQAAHNLATFNPDWEIIRCPVTNTIEVKYCPGVFS